MTTTETNRRLQAALHYVTLGWPVVPLHTPADGVCDCPKKDACPSPGKHPRTMHGLEDASADPDKIRRWWSMWPQANVAIDLARSGLVDIAPDSVAWWAEFMAQGLPPTLNFTSGGGEGHQHWLYARPEGCPSHRLTRTGDYDVLSAGYAVMPTSLHQSGREYRWLPDGLHPEAPPDEPAPAWAIRMLVEATTRHAAGPAPAEEADDAPPVELLAEGRERWYGRLYERKPDGSVDRSYSLWWLAVRLLEAGAQPRFCEQLLAERDIVLGWTKFTGRADAARRYAIIVEAARRGQGPKRVRVGQQRATTETREPPKSTLQYLTAVQLASLEDDDLGWHARGYLARSLITELDGKVKRSGKTTLMLAMAHAILHGEPFLDQPTEYSPIVYLTEQSGPSFKRLLARAGLLDREDFHILLWSSVIGWKWTNIIADVLAQMTRVGASILVSDTLGQFTGIDDENNAAAALEAMKPLQTAASKGMAILVSRHDRKSGGDVGDSGRGSSAYAGAVDVILHLQRLAEAQPGTERQRLLESLSRFDETPLKQLIELNTEPPYRYSLLGDADEVRQRDLSQEILACLPTERERAVTLDELLPLVQARATEIRRVLKLLVNQGDVVRLGQGVSGKPYRFYQRVYEGED